MLIKGFGDDLSAFRKQCVGSVDDVLFGHVEHILEKVMHKYMSISHLDRFYTSFLKYQLVLVLKI